MTGLLTIAAAAAADGAWLGPAAEAPAAVVDVDVDAALNVAVYGVAPQVGARIGWSPARRVSVGASAGGVAPTATLSAVGVRALLLDAPGVRVAAIGRGAAATRFDGGLELLVGGAGFAAEGEVGRLAAGFAVPVVGLEQSMAWSGPRWLPGLWDASASVAVGREARVRLELGVATSLTLVTASCTARTRWGRWQVGLVGNGAVNALGAGVGRSWGQVAAGP